MRKILKCSHHHCINSNILSRNVRMSTKFSYKTSLNTFFCKRLACMNVINLFALSECGRYSLSVTYMFKWIEYWTKFISMSSERYPKQCCTMIKRLDEVSNLGNAHKQLLYQFGFGYVWIAKERGDPPCFCVI